MNCPKCGEECMRDEVHNGVAMIYGPYGCFCGWSENEEYDRSEGLSPAEIRTGCAVDSRGGLFPSIPAQTQEAQAPQNALKPCAWDSDRTLRIKDAIKAMYTALQESERDDHIREDGRSDALNKDRGDGEWDPFREVDNGDVPD